MKNFTLITFIVFTLFYSCNNTSVTNKADYQAYLDTDLNTDSLNKDLNFWSTKLEKAPNQYPYLVKRASIYSKYFDATGKIEYLKKAEKDLLTANKSINYNNTGYLKALAHNYISQHKFNDALELLKKAEANGEKLRGTQKMLFDVHLELGNNTSAEKYLELIKNFSDFDYLIRLSKWEDYNGNLDGAIKYMERATKMAKSSSSKSLKQWSYTNLADFYGHAGKIKLSYTYYLKALELNPSDAYAKKGIAWVVYSHERNTDEALRILNQVSEYYNAPDYELLKAEIAEYIGDKQFKEKAIARYSSKVKNKFYGDMYNQYNILLFAENKKEVTQALKIAKKEIKNRPTALAYDLLAWSHYKSGNVVEAVKIINEHVIDKTEEPTVLYHIAEIYKAAGRTEEVLSLKKELIASIYELGPTMEQKINNL